MNCRSGELAQVVRACSGSACDRAMIGRTIIRVTESFVTDGVAMWRYEGELRTCPLSNFCLIFAYEDRVLQPLRGEPLPDADETTSERTKELTS